MGLAAGLLQGVGQGLASFASLKAAKEAQDAENARLQRALDIQSARDQAEAADRARRMSDQERQQTLENQQNALSAFRENLPEGAKIPDAGVAMNYATHGLDAARLVANLASPGTGVAPTVSQPQAPDLAGALRTASTRIVRPSAANGYRGIAGESGGVFVSPKPYGVSVSIDGNGGSGKTTVASQEADAALQSAYEMMDRMEAAVNRSPDANVEPTSAAVAEGVGSLLPGVELKRAGHLFAQRYRTPDQNIYNNASTVFSHLYPQFQAHSRLGPTYVAMMQDAMTGAMDTSLPPSVRAQKLQQARSTLNSFWSEMHPGEAVPMPGAMLSRLTGDNGGSGGASPAAPAAPRRATGPRISPFTFSSGSQP